VKARDILVALFLLAFSALCARLGFWQLARLHEKQRLNSELRAALAAPVVEVGGVAALASLPPGQTVRLAGRFDPTHQILLRGRLREGDPGVEVVTPWRVAGDSAVLVSRGWLPAEDGATLPAARIPEDTSTTVTGRVERFVTRGLPAGLHELERESTRVWSAARLDRDTAAAHLPYAVAPVWIAALPGAGAPASPRRELPAPYNESMHLGYAIQWFAIGTLVPVGVLAMLRVRRRRAAPRERPS
jgi:surfeit locus 1 family protein